MKKIGLTIISFSIAIFFIVGSMVFLGQLAFFYSFEFDKLGVIEKAGIHETSEDIADVFIAYFNEDIDEFQMTADVDGTERLLYNEREQLHMADVKLLVERGNMVTAICFLVSLGVYLTLLFKQKKKLLRHFIKSGIILYYGTLAFLGISMILNFKDAFRIFHELVFNNDLWLLNAQKDYLLMLMPQPLYVDMLIYSFIISAIGIISLGAVTWKITKEKGKQKIFS